MEKLRLITSWQPLSNQTTMLISNVQIQGAIFDGRELRAVAQTAPAFAVVPPLSVAWMGYDDEVFYACFMQC